MELAQVSSGNLIDTRAHIYTNIGQRMKSSVSIGQEGVKVSHRKIKDIHVQHQTKRQAGLGKML